MSENENSPVKIVITGSKPLLGELEHEGDNYTEEIIINTDYNQELIDELDTLSKKIIIKSYNKDASNGFVAAFTVIIALTFSYLLSVNDNPSIYSATSIVSLMLIVTVCSFRAGHHNCLAENDVIDSNHDNYYNITIDCDWNDFVHISDMKIISRATKKIKYRIHKSFKSKLIECINKYNIDSNE